MTPTLQEDLRQGKPFSSLYQEAQLNLERTQSVLQNSFERVFRDHGISGTQYNVLRILRGAESNGLCRNEIRDRMIARMPDVTRLLDRMEEAGLVSRSRDSEDRRLVTTRLTAAGRALVDSLDVPVEAEHKRALGHMTEGELRSLIELLTLARQGK